LDYAVPDNRYAVALRHKIEDGRRGGHTLVLAALFHAYNDDLCICQNMAEEYLTLNPKVMRRKLTVLSRGSALKLGFCARRDG
jgi:hypothetical protein